MVQKFSEIPVKARKRKYLKRYYLFSENFPPGWTIPFEFAPELPKIPFNGKRSRYKMQTEYTYRGPIAWNILPESYKLIDSWASFKQKIKKDPALLDKLSFEKNHVWAQTRTRIFIISDFTLFPTYFLYVLDILSLLCNYLLTSFIFILHLRIFNIVIR